MHFSPGELNDMVTYTMSCSPFHKTYRERHTARHILSTMKSIREQQKRTKHSALDMCMCVCNHKAADTLCLHPTEMLARMLDFNRDDASAAAAKAGDSG